MHNMCHRRLSCWCKRFKISLEVAALYVAAPLTVAFNGDATILSPTTVDELITKVGHRDAWQHASLMRHVRSRGERECAIVGSCRPPSWCGVLMVAMTS
jgi:hypothetical protein